MSKEFQIQARRQGKSLIIKNLVALAQARGRTVYIGSSKPEERYKEFREVCPQALIVIDKYGIAILGKKS